MASVEVESVDGVRRRLVIEVPAQDVTREIDRAFSELGKTATVRGFRRGRVPRRVLERVAGDKLRSDVFERLVQDSFIDAIRDENIEPVGQPEIETESSAEAGKPLRYTATVEVVPEIELSSYDGIAAERPLRTIGDQDVEDFIEHVRRSATRIEPITDRDDTRAGDVATVDYDVRDGEKLLGRAEDRLIEVGGDDPYEIGAQILDANVGDDVHFDMDFPEDFENSNLAGRLVRVEVSIKALGTREVPPLNDDLAKSYGGYDNLEEMRAGARKELQERADRVADDSVRASIIESLLREHEFEVPHAMVHRRAHGLVDEMISQMGARRPTASQEHEAREQLMKSAEPRAREQVRSSLLLEAIAKAEGIEISDDEIDREIEQIVQTAGYGADRLRSLYSEPTARMGLRKQLMRQRALDQVVEKANVLTVEEKTSVAGDSGKG